MFKNSLTDCTAKPYSYTKEVRQEGKQVSQMSINRSSLFSDHVQVIINESISPLLRFLLFMLYWRINYILLAEVYSHNS